MFDRRPAQQLDVEVLGTLNRLVHDFDAPPHIRDSVQVIAEGCLEPCWQSNPLRGTAVALLSDFAVSAPTPQANRLSQILLYVFEYAHHSNLADLTETAAAIGARTDLDAPLRAELSSDLEKRAASLAGSAHGMPAGQALAVLERTDLHRAGAAACHVILEAAELLGVVAQARAGRPSMFVGEGEAQERLASGRHTLHDAYELFQRRGRDLSPTERARAAECFHQLFEWYGGRSHEFAGFAAAARAFAAFAPEEAARDFDAALLTRIGTLRRHPARVLNDPHAVPELREISAFADVAIKHPPHPAALGSLVFHLRQLLSNGTLREKLNR